MKLKGLLFFDEILVVPKVITFIYWILLLFALLATVCSIIVSLFVSTWVVKALWCTSLTSLIIVFLFRLGGEHAMVKFRIHEDLKKVLRVLEKDTH